MASAILVIINSPSTITSNITLRPAAPITAPRSAVHPVPIPIQTGIIIRIPLTPEQVAEHPPQIGNVRLGLELETATVCQVLGELGGTSLTQRRNGDGLFLLHDELVLFRRALGLEALPGQSPLEEVHEDVSDGLQVVAAGLLHPQVVVDGGITGRAGEGPSLPLGNVLEGARMAVSLRQSEIDAVDEVPRTAPVGDEIGRLDVAMDEMAAVHDLDALEHLIGDHQDGLEAESASAFVELILEGGTQQVHDHEIVGVLRSEVVDLGEARRVLELAVDLVFVTELGTAGSVLFEFYGHLFPVGADAEVDVPEGTSADSFGDAIFGDGGLHSI